MKIEVTPSITLETKDVESFCPNDFEKLIYSGIEKLEEEEFDPLFIDLKDLTIYGINNAIPETYDPVFYHVDDNYYTHTWVDGYSLKIQEN